MLDLIIGAQTAEFRQDCHQQSNKSSSKLCYYLKHYPVAKSLHQLPESIKIGVQFLHPKR